MLFFWFHDNDVIVVVVVVDASSNVLWAIAKDLYSVLLILLSVALSLLWLWWASPRSINNGNNRWLTFSVISFIVIMSPSISSSSQRVSTSARCPNNTSSSGTNAQYSTSCSSSSSLLLLSPSFFTTVFFTNDMIVEIRNIARWIWGGDTWNKLHNSFVEMILPLGLIFDVSMKNWDNSCILISSFCPIKNDDPLPPGWVNRHFVMIALLSVLLDIGSIVTQLLLRRFFVGEDSTKPSSSLSPDSTISSVFIFPPCCCCCCCCCSFFHNTTAFDEPTVTNFNEVDGVTILADRLLANIWQRPSHKSSIIVLLILFVVVVGSWNKTKSDFVALLLMTVAIFVFVVFVVDFISDCGKERRTPPSSLFFLLADVSGIVIGL